MCYTSVDREEASRLVDSRLSNRAIVTVMDKHDVVNVMDVTLEESKYVRLLNKGHHFCDYHYNQNPDCGRQILIIMGDLCGLSVHYSIEVAK